MCICKGVCGVLVAINFIRMQEQLQEMAEQDLVNPYEALYRNMNLDITEDINKETAEKVARQLGYLHNTFGVVVKDLIKILSFKFKSDTSAPLNDQKRKTSPLREEQFKSPKYREPPSVEIMDSEEKETLDIFAMRKKRVIDKEGRGATPVDVVQHQEAVASFEEKKDGTQEKPPNLDFLGEFAYQKSGHEESKKLTKERINDTFKERLSKIMQEVNNKRRKSSKSPPNNSEEKTKQKQIVIRKQTVNLKMAGHSSPESQKSPPIESSSFAAESHPLRQDDPKPPQSVQNVQIFEQFEYKEEAKSPERVVAELREEQTPSIVQNQNTNRIWHLLNQAGSRDSPPVYEISDDDD